MAAACPGLPAVIADDTALTIGDLYAHSLSISASLRRLGVGAGDRVALAMHKSPESISAIYGILAAGGVFVPVQPDWPRARIDAILQDCDARIVISNDGPSADAPPRVVDRRSGASRDWTACLATPPILEADVSRSADDPALILFTSGSTGAPKGVTLSHRAVGAFVDWTARQFRLEPGDRIGCPSPLSFDLSTFDVFNIARSGSASVVVPQAAIWIPRLLSRLVREAQITTRDTVPSLLAHSLEGGLVPGAFDSLRVILFAGEVMPPRVAARLRAAAPGAELCNLYGPTETNVVTWYRLCDPIDTSRPIPIGRPCPYARVRLDPATEERRDGQASGLLLVAGESLMSGYWNRPAETAEVLVSLPGEDDPSRYYRTGDRVVIDLGWPVGVRRSYRPAGEAARLPDRAGRRSRQRLPTPRSGRRCCGGGV